MIVFWITTALAAAFVVWLVLDGARSGAATVEAPAAGAAELEELDRLKARGLIDGGAHASARAEAARRLLAQGTETLEPWERPSDRLWVLGGAAGTVALTLGLYFVVGSPGAPDQPYERRVDQWATQLETLEPTQLAAVVERVVRERPRDRQALTMLGAARFEAGDPIGASTAFRRALEMDAEDPQTWARLGESLVRTNQGVVGGDAEAAFNEALRRDPNQLGARFFLGEAALARGELERVRTLWAPLIEVLPPDDPRRADLISRLAAAEAASGAG